MTPLEWMTASEEQARRLKEMGATGPYEKEYFRKDGSRRWMLFTGRDLGDGTLGEYVVDISGIKHAEAALARNQELSPSGRQGVSIAREISLPLEAITNLLSSMKMDEALDGETKQRLNQAEAELLRVTHITRRTLESNRD
jgi:hypothetical protein